MVLGRHPLERARRGARPRDRHRGRRPGRPRRGDRLAPEPRAGPRGHDDRGPAPHPRRRRVGQDARARSPDRLPHRRRATSRRGRSSRSRSRTRRRPRCASGSSGSSAIRAVTWRWARSIRCAPACCAATARSIGIDPRFIIYDTDDQTSLVKQVLRDLDLAGTGELRPSAVLGAISRWKNDLIEPARGRRARARLPRGQFAQAYARYQAA